MPFKEFGLPIGVTNVRAVKDEVEYPIDTTHIHSRTGSAGVVRVLTLNTGDKYSGEIYEAQWRKNRDANIGGANQPFVAKLDTTNHLLLMYGEAAAAGTAGNGWINSRNPIVFIDDTEIVVELESPIADTGAVASRDISFGFYLIPSFVETIPSGQTNYLQIYYNVTESGLLFTITKYVNSVSTTFWDGSTKDGNSVRDPAANQFWKFKLVFNSKPGTTGATVSIYAKKGNSRANMELDIWEELYDSVGTQDSPFSISNLAFHVGYPCYVIYTQNTSYFDDVGDEAKSTTLEVTYPDFQLKWSDTDTDYTGGCELYDGDPSSSGQRVLSQDHVFSGDIYMRNGLIGLKLDELAQCGFIAQCYYSATWNDVINRVYHALGVTAQTLIYYKLISVKTDPRSPELITLNLRVRDTATEDEDHYMDFDLTLRRGCYLFEMTSLTVNPNQVTDTFTTRSTPLRFGYVGNNLMGDDDLNVALNNTTISDNYAVNFDNAGDAVLVVLSTRQKPVRYRFSAAGSLYTDDQPVGDTTYFGVVPFSLIANIFKEAEDATLGGGATVVDPDAAASNLKSVLLNAQNETVYYSVIAGTNLPAGRYLAAFRIRDINLVAGDVGLRVYNNTDSVYRNQMNEYDNRLVTAAYLYYCIPFDITDADVTGTDTLYIQVNKQTATANEIYVDYMVLVFLGDGRDGPQDLAHAALLTVDQRRRVFRR